MIEQKIGKKHVMIFSKDTVYAIMDEDSKLDAEVERKRIEDFLNNNRRWFLSKKKVKVETKLVNYTNVTF